MQIYEKYHKEYVKACEQFKEERSLFFEELKRIPFLKVYPSQANYFLCQVKGGLTSRQLAIALLNNNVLIKDCGTKKAFNGGNYIRIAIRDRKDNQRLIKELNRI